MSCGPDIADARVLRTYLTERARVVLLLAVTFASPITALCAEPALRYLLQPGMVTVYDVQIETVQRVRHRPEIPVQREVQKGKLTRVLFLGSGLEPFSCAQMLQLEAGEVTAGAAESQPSPTTSPLILGSPARVQFSVGPATERSNPLLLPSTTSLPRATLGTIATATDWPDRAIAAGETWSEPFQAVSTAAHRRFRIDTIESVRDDRRITITVTIEPDTLPADADAGFVSARAVLGWSARKGELLSLDGTVVYRDPPAKGNRELEQRVTLNEVSRRRLPAGREPIELKALIEMAQAIAAYQRDDNEDATRRLKQFIKRRRTSIWCPMAEYLDRRIASERTGRESLPSDQLKEALAGLLALYDRADAEGDVNALDRSRKSLRHVAEVNRPEIVRMLDDPDGRFRALACFALAFGEPPADVALLEMKLADPDIQVRRLALLALAVRASPLTDAGSLLAAIEEEDEAIRYRACLALAACVGPESPRLEQARAALMDRLNDGSLPVMLAAAQGIMRIGSQAEINRLEELADRQESGILKATLSEHLGAPPATAPGP